ncbi:MAG: hypothetical protein AAFW84_30425 [Cyanobacteria bacterium J06635_15]
MRYREPDCLWTQHPGDIRCIKQSGQRDKTRVEIETVGSTMRSQWITGTFLSGKTAQLIQQLMDWDTFERDAGQTWLVFAANGDNRIALAERIAAATEGRVAITTTTPAGWIQDEVVLFWPLLVEQVPLKAQFPLKLRPENEQELATRLWRSQLDNAELQVAGWREYDLVRHALDFLQLAASAGVAAEEIGTMLQDGMPAGMAEAEMWQAIGEALVKWRNWCLQRGLLPYGVMTELYWQHLLPHPDYQAQLKTRFCGVLADDVDDYPAIAQQWFSTFLSLALPCAFTYNPDAQLRLGLGADPADMATLADSCEAVQLSPPTDTIGATWADTWIQWVNEPFQAVPELPEMLHSIQTVSRGELLRLTAETITEAIHTRQVQPSDVAVIAPGLDAIGRYTLTNILTQRGIGVEALSDQRPPISSPLVRSLLTLLTLVYPGLGRWVDQDAIAEMLVVLSQAPSLDVGQPWMDLVRIDPVRAELLADHCFVPDPNQPELLPVNRFPRWDRLGFQATQAYDEIREWIADQKQQQQQRLLANAVSLLDRAIQRFLWRGNHLPFDQLATLRELMETAQYYWEVEGRLALYPDPLEQSQHSARPMGRRKSAETEKSVANFIQLLRSGTVTANPHPVKPLNPNRQNITLATAYQYRTYRLSHPWHFWLDAGSPRWLTNMADFPGWPIFLKNWSGRSLTTQQMEELNDSRLACQLKDLLGRVTQRLYLCHSDLAISGQEQVGPLLNLVTATQTVITPPKQTA